MSVVCEFPKVFLENVTKLPPKKVEYTIDLTPKSSFVSITLYRMSRVELGEVKNQVEDLLRK